MKRILIATDGSDGAWAAVEEGLALAAETGADVTFVSVRQRLGSLVDDPQYQHRLTEDLDSVHAALKPAEAEAQHAGIDYESDILEGDPVERIAQAARGWDADLVVVGSRGHGALASCVMGSVSRGLLTRSPVPVMVVRTARRTARPRTDLGVAGYGTGGGFPVGR